MGQGAVIANSNRRLNALRKSLQADIERLLLELDAKGGKLIGAGDALANASRVRSQVLSILQADGAPVVILETEQAAMDATREALRTRGIGTGDTTATPSGLEVSTVAEAESTVRSSIRGLLDDLSPLWANAADVIREAIDVGVNTGAPLRGLVAEVKDRLAITVDQSGVVVEAAIRAATTRATTIQAEAAARATGEAMGYLYDGPDDVKTRPFCEPLVGVVFTLDALRRMDNGQGLPVETHRGGYRCRHRLSPILISDAEAEGYEVVK